MPKGGLSPLRRAPRRPSMAMAAFPHRTPGAVWSTRAPGHAAPCDHRKPVAAYAAPDRLAPACSLATCSVSRSSQEPDAGRQVTVAGRADAVTREWPSIELPLRYGKAIATMTPLTGSQGRKFMNPAPQYHPQCDQEMLALMRLQPSSAMAWQGSDHSSGCEGHSVAPLLSFADIHHDLSGVRRSHHERTTP
jgi:hypothetical protein